MEVLGAVLGGALRQRSPASLGNAEAVIGGALALGAAMDAPRVLLVRGNAEEVNGALLAIIGGAVEVSRVCLILGVAEEARGCARACVAADVSGICLVLGEEEGALGAVLVLWWCRRCPVNLSYNEGHCVFRPGTKHNATP